MCAGPFSQQTQVHTYYTQYCDLLDLRLKISLILQNLANATIGTSLAIHMTEDMMLEVRRRKMHF